MSAQGLKSDFSGHPGNLESCFWENPVFGIGSMYFRRLGNPSIGVSDEFYISAHSLLCGSAIVTNTFPQLHSLKTQDLCQIINFIIDLANLVFDLQRVPSAEQQQQQQQPCR
jgi:hypothetical protein